MPSDDTLAADVAEMRRLKTVPGQNAQDDFSELCYHLAPRLADECERLREALRTLAQWQVERRPGASGEMCDFADAALEGRDDA